MALDSFEPSHLGCLLEAAANAEGLTERESAVSAPRLPASTVKLIRDSWQHMPKDSFGKEFLIRLLSEPEETRSIFNSNILTSDNVEKVMELLVGLLDSEQVPRFEQVTHAAAALCHHFGSLRMQHLASLKRSLTRTIVMFTPSKEKRKTSRAWEAFFYTVAAVVAPHLALSDTLPEFIAASAAPLPVPAGGAQSAAVAAQGAALVEMCLNITGTQTEGKTGESLPREVSMKLSEVRVALVDLVRSEINVYCGHIATVFGKQDNDTGTDADEKERRLWLRRATEVPLKIAEHSLGVVKSCMRYRKQILRSLENDWRAGVKLLHTAMEISLGCAETVLNCMAMDQEQRSTIEVQLAHLRSELGREEFFET